MSRPESSTRPERRIRIGARFTPTFSIIFPKHVVYVILFWTFLIKRNHFFSGNPMTIYKFKRPITFTINTCIYKQCLYIHLYSCYSFLHAFNIPIIYQSHIMHSQCNSSFHNHFMRFKHIHNNPITLVNIDYSIHNFWRIPFDESHPYYHLVMCLYISQLYLPSWRMPFGASRHVVSIIRSPIMTDVV